jgi:hypothetical protein
MQVFDAILPVLATAFFLAGLGALCILLAQILRIARLSKREKKYRLVGWQSDARRALLIIGALCFIALGNVVFWTNRQLRLYTQTYPGTPVGMISVLKPDGARNLPRLVLSTTDEQGKQAFEVFPVRDAMFRITGERIRWSKKLEGFGLTDFFKVTRLEFLPKDLALDSGKTPFFVDVRQGSTVLYDQIRSWDEWLPFVTVDSLNSLPYQAQGEYSVQLYIDSTAIILR